VKDFVTLYQQLDQTNSSNAKKQALAQYFRVADPADAAWAVFVLSGRRQKRLIGSAQLRQWLAEVSGLPGWLVEQSYAHVGDLAETVALLTSLPLTAIRCSLQADGVKQIEREEQQRQQQQEGKVETESVNSAAFTESTESTESLQEIMEALVQLRQADDADKESWVKRHWLSRNKSECFVLNKLLTGALRVGVSQTLVAKSLSEEFALETGLIQRRLMGNWTPSACHFCQLIAPDDGGFQLSQPYPFYLASPLDASSQGACSQNPGYQKSGSLSTGSHTTDSDKTTSPDPSSACALAGQLGDHEDWLVEWKWDGIRAQLIKREGQVFLWSRGEDLIMDAFPEIVSAAHRLADGLVLDGEILAWGQAGSENLDEQDGPLNFNALQRRLGRKKAGKKLLSEVPVKLLAFDLLEYDGKDIRTESTLMRRELLQQVVETVNADCIGISTTLQGSWQQLSNLRATSRQRSVEGLMLKKKTAAYQVGRVKGDWWKWKVDPYTIDAVLLYAQAGHGRRSNLYTDYTFAVWDGSALVTIAKAYSGLTDKEIKVLDQWIRKHTLERFGPVRSVQPHHVFELAFEGIARSGRHKSGIAVRFPRIVRWRQDKTIKDADTLQQVQQLLN